MLRLLLAAPCALLIPAVSSAMATGPGLSTAAPEKLPATTSVLTIVGACRVPGLELDGAFRAQVKADAE